MKLTYHTINVLLSVALLAGSDGTESVSAAGGIGSQGNQPVDANADAHRHGPNTGQSASALGRSIRPPRTNSCATVDCIVINRVRSVRDVEKPGMIGGVVTVRETSSQWWVIFVRRYPWNMWKPFSADEEIVNCGWRALQGVRIAPTNHGWAADCGDLTVFAPVLIYMSTPYDWETTKRQTYKPLKP